MGHSEARNFGSELVCVCEYLQWYSCRFPSTTVEHVTLINSKNNGVENKKKKKEIHVKKSQRRTEKTYKLVRRVVNTSYVLLVLLLLLLSLYAYPRLMSAGIKWVKCQTHLHRRRTRAVVIIPIQCCAILLVSPVPKRFPTVLLLRTNFVFYITVRDFFFFFFPSFFRLGFTSVPP